MTMTDYALAGAFSAIPTTIVTTPMVLSVSDHRNVLRLSCRLKIKLLEVEGTQE